MARKHSGVVGQGVDLRPDGVLQSLKAASRQIRAANAAVEECISNEGGLHELGIEKNVAGAMPGYMAHLKIEAQGLEAIALTHPVVNLHRSNLHSRDHIGTHDLRGLDHGSIIGVRPDLCPGLGDHLGGILDMVPVAMRYPELQQTAVISGQKGLDLLPNAFRGIN